MRFAFLKPKMFFLSCLQSVAGNHTFFLLNFVVMRTLNLRSPLVTTFQACKTVLLTVMEYYTADV